MLDVCDHLGMTKELEARKLTAVHAFYATVQKDERGSVTSTREQVVEGIRALSGVVNSAKWRNAVEDYAALVEDTEHTLDWAYGQGSIWFSIAIMS